MLKFVVTINKNIKERELRIRVLMRACSAIVTVTISLENLVLEWSERKKLESDAQKFPANNVLVGTPGI